MCFFKKLYWGSESKYFRFALLGLLCFIILIESTQHPSLQNQYFLIVLSIYTILTSKQILNQISYSCIIFLVISYYWMIKYQFDIKILHLICFPILYFSLRAIVGKFHSTWFPLLFIVGIIESAIVMLQYMGLIVSNNHYFSVTGTFFNPGPCGCFLTVISVLALLYMYTRISIVKIYTIKKRFVLNFYIYLLASMSFVFTIIAIVLTESRTSIFALFATIFVYFINKIYKKSNAFGLFTIIFFLFLIGMYLLYTIRPMSVESRFLIWRISLSAIQKHFFFGKGIGTYRNSLAEAQEEFYNSNSAQNEIKLADVPEYAFNEYIEFTSEIGFIGVILSLIIIFYIIIKQKDIFKYGIVAILFMSLTSYPLHILPIQVLFTIFLSLHGSKIDSTKITCKIFFLILFILMQSIVTFCYCQKILMIKEWENQCLIAKNSIVEVRNLNDYHVLFQYINDNPDFLLDYGELLYKKKLYRESIEILKKGIKKSNDPIFLILVGLNYEKLQNYTLAEYFYNKAFFRVPNRLHPLYRLALLYYNSGNIGKFMSMSKTIFEFEPKIESDIVKIMKKEINAIFEKVRLEQCPECRVNEKNRIQIAHRE